MSHLPNKCYYVSVMKSVLIAQNLKSRQTIFTLSDIANLLGKEADVNLVANVNYYVKKGEIINLSKGIYALNQEYNKLEFANKLRRPSYISFYTVLQKEGVIFQEYQTILLAANRSEAIEKDDFKIKYRQIKDEVLLNPLGIKVNQNYSIATKERALCDKIYLDGLEYFDNLVEINWSLVDNLLVNVYKSKTLPKLIKELKNAK